MEPDIISAQRLRRKSNRAINLILLFWPLLLMMSHDVVRAPELTSPSPAVKRILLLNEPGPEFPGRQVFEEGFHSVLGYGRAGSFEFYSETLEMYRHPGESHGLLMRDYLRRKYAGVKIDVIAAWPEIALAFLLQHRDELFPGVPIVYISVKRPDPTQLPRDVTGIWVGPKLQETLQLALDLHPSTEHVFVILGRLNNSGLLESEVRAQLTGFENKISLNYLIDLPLDEVITKVKNLPERSAIFYVRQTRGVGDTSITPLEAAALISQSSNVPIYGIVDTWVGSGIVGGRVVSMESVGAELATIALKVVNGTRPEDIPVQQAPTVPMFDWRQLRRFHISEDRLPPGSVVSFKEFTFWEQYKGRIIAVLAILIFQTLLLAGLLFERARKKRATRQLVESEERFAKAFRANPQPMSLTTLAEGRYLDVNESFLRMSGYTRDEVIGHTSSELGIFQDPGDRDTQLVQPLLHAGVAHYFEFQFRMKNGAFRTLLSSAELLELAGEKCILVASSDITERKDLEQELTQLTAQLFRLQDEERRRIARELHDETAQNLFGISMNLAKLNQFRQEPEARRLIDECESLGNESLQEIRTLSYLLHPPLLDEAGLVSALQWYVQGFSKRSGIYVDLMAQPIDRLPPDVELAFFRVVQESLTNVRRHSGSETASIRLECNAGDIVLEIQDKGHGMPSPKIPQHADDLIEMGVGIPGMQQRLRQLGGRLEIASNSEGTKIKAVVPATNGASHGANSPGGRS